MITGSMSTGNLGDFKKQQDYIYTSTAAYIGFGNRSKANEFPTDWVPAPEYNVTKGGANNDAPKFKYPFTFLHLKIRISFPLRNQSAQYPWTRTWNYQPKVQGITFNQLNPRF